MSAFLNNRKALLTLAIVVAVVAIVVPMCRMTGCSMSIGSAMPWGHHSVPGLFGDCGGEYVVNAAPSAIVPSGSDAITVALLWAVIAAVAAFVPRFAVSRVVAVGVNAPPETGVSWGERLRL